LPLRYGGEGEEVALVDCGGNGVVRNRAMKVNAALQPSCGGRRLQFLLRWAVAEEMEFPGSRLGARAGATGDEMLKSLQEIDQVLLRHQPSEKAEAEAMAAVRKWMGHDRLRRDQRDRLDHTAITIFAELFRET
jgi:hypothetical protein